MQGFLNFGTVGFLNPTSKLTLEWNWNTWEQLMTEYVKGATGDEERYGVYGWFAQFIFYSTGETLIKFDADKTFKVLRKGKTIRTGTYTMNDSEVTLTFKGKKTPCKVTPQLDNGTLVIVMDATKLKTFMQNIGSNVSQLSTIVSLMKSMDGMKVGVRLSK